MRLRAVFHLFQHAGESHVHMLQVGLAVRAGAEGGSLAGKPFPEIVVAFMDATHARQVPFQFIGHDVQCFAVNFHVWPALSFRAGCVAAQEQ